MRLGGFGIQSQGYLDGRQPAFLDQVGSRDVELRLCQGKPVIQRRSFDGSVLKSIDNYAS